MRDKVVNLYSFFEPNINRLAFIIVVHVLLTICINLPYLNITGPYISFVPYVVDWILVISLFHFRTQTLMYLITGSIFVVSGFTLFGFDKLAEPIGDFIFLALITYVFLVIKNNHD